MKPAGIYIYIVHARIHIHDLTLSIALGRSSRALRRSTIDRSRSIDSTILQRRQDDRSLESVTYRFVHVERSRGRNRGQSPESRVCRRSSSLAERTARVRDRRQREVEDYDGDDDDDDERTEIREVLRPPMPPAARTGDERFTPARISGKRIDKPITIAVPPRWLALGG